MPKYILLRIARWIPGVILLLLFVYALMFYGAGDPVRLMFLKEPGDVAWDTERMNAIREELGLNRSFLVQFGEYIGKVFKGDLGNSLVQRRSVNDMIKSTFPVTLQIALAAAFLVGLFGIPLGIIAALNQNGFWDNLILGAALFVWSIPSFVTAPLLMVLLCLNFKILPVPYGWKGVFTVNAILPLFVASFRPMALVIRQTRTGVISVLSEDYIRTAKAKGLSGFTIVVKHALRPVLTPVVTQLGIVFSNLISGSLFIEIIFGIPGIGRLMKSSIVDSDYSALMGCVLVILAVITLINLIIDIIYPLLDPRLRAQQVREK